MNFGKLLNDSVSASEDQPASSSQQEQQRANGLQHILDAATGDSNEGSTTASNAYPATHSVAKDPQLLQQQQNEPGSAPSPSRAPHFTTYGVDPTPMDTDSTVEVPAPAAAFDLLSAAAQQALDPMRSLPDSYLAELNQPVPSSSSTNVGVPLPPAVQVVHASQERRSRRNGTNSLVSPSSVVPDSDEDAEGDADVDAEGEDDEDVVMSDREAKVGSETSSGARRDKSVKTEDEDVSMQGTSPAMEEHWSIHKVHNAGAKVSFCAGSRRAVDILADPLARAVASPRAPKPNRRRLERNAKPTRSRLAKRAPHSTATTCARSPPPSRPAAFASSFPKTTTSPRARARPRKIKTVSRLSPPPSLKLRRRTSPPRPTRPSPRLQLRLFSTSPSRLDRPRRPYRRASCPPRSSRTCRPREATRRTMTFSRRGIIVARARGGCRSRSMGTSTTRRRMSTTIGSTASVRRCMIRM